MPFVIALDYDDTCFIGGYKVKGKPNKEVLDKAIEFKENGAQIALWTCREGEALAEAIVRCKEYGLEFNSINENTPCSRSYIEEQIREKGVFIALRKVLADLYVDDKANGSIDYFISMDVKKTCKEFKDR